MTGKQPITNRRRSRRCPVKTVTRIECRVDAAIQGPNLTILALDLSETGVRLVVRQPLEERQTVEVLLFGLGLSKPLQRMGYVVWTAPKSAAEHCVGIAFYTPLTRLWWQASVAPPSPEA